MSEKPRYWFRAKRYGWGWGLPSSWQGWVVLAAFIVLTLVGAAWLRPGASGAGLSYAAYIGVLVLTLVLVCYLKGEPPRFRWGKR